MRTVFKDKLVQFVLIDLEGGERITEDPNDPGGLTKFGISQRAYPKEDIRNLTYSRAATLAVIDYWDKVKGDHLPEMIAGALFDCAFNSGTRRSIQLLQRALDINEDGIIGPNTIREASQAKQYELLAQVLMQRAWFLSQLERFPIYGRGWLARLFKLQAFLVIEGG